MEDSSSPAETGWEKERGSFLANLAEGRTMSHRKAADPHTDQHGASERFDPPREYVRGEPSGKRRTPSVLNQASRMLSSAGHALSGDGDEAVVILGALAGAAAGLAIGVAEKRRQSAAQQAEAPHNDPSQPAPAQPSAEPRQEPASQQIERPWSSPCDMGCSPDHSGKESDMASIKKINSRKYKITVSNGYRVNGKKIARAKTIHVPESVHPRSIAQYVAHEAEEFERLVKNGFGEDADTPFEDFARSWLKRQTAKYAPGTLAMYTQMLEVTFRYIGQIPLSKLRPIALENMLIELRKRTHHGKPVQEATVQKYLTAVSAVLSDAKRNEIIQKNPARMIDLPDAKPHEQFIPNPAEVERFIRALTKEPFHYIVYYLLAICTGCRRGELCALKWSDFLMESVADLAMVVSRSRSSVAGVGVVEGTTKSGRTRVIALDEGMSLLLCAFFLYKNCEAERNRYPFSEYLFTDERGRLIHPDTFTKHLRKFYDRHGFPKEYHLHTLRHLYVTTLLHGGVDKQTVADLAGHRDTSFLERTYCHPQMERKLEAARVISGIIPGSAEDKSA